MPTIDRKADALQSWPMNATLDLRSPGISGLELLRATGISARVPRHVHSTWCVVIVEKGQRHIRLADREFVVESGQVGVIAPGVAHECFGPANALCDYRVFCLTEDLLERLLGGKPASPSGAWIWSKPVPELIDGHQRIMQTGQAGETENALAHFIEIFQDPACLPHGCTPPLAASSAVAQAKSILDAQAEQGPSLDELARYVGLSPFYLARRFTREVGLPPHAYLTLAKLRQARKLLAQGLPLADTALACGFYDQSHFCLRFKQYMGVSPGQLRQSCP